MARHRSQAQFERARWRLRFLGPAWFLQLALTIALMALFAWRLGDTFKHYDEREGKGEKPTIEIVWEVANVVFSFIAAACTIFEMVRYWGEVLTPWTMLFTHVLKTVCGAAIMALDIVVLFQLEDKNYSFVSVGLCGAFLIIVAGLQIWIIFVYRRVSVHDDYAGRSNVKSYGFSDGLDVDGPRGSRRLSTSSFIDKQRRPSFSSLRRSSVDATAAPPNEMGPLQRTPSYYTHQRDTQFDEYMARRGSYGGKADVEAALGTEYFGSNAGQSATSPGGTAQDEDVVVSTGMVGSNKPGQMTSRSLSTTSDHVLVAVPEAHEGDEGEEDDKRALLGQKRRRSSTDLGGPTRESLDVVPRWQQQQR